MDEMEAGARQGTLVARLRDVLKLDIENGGYAPGDRLPSEAQLCRDHGVSRTVVREAVAALRADGLVEPRQGAGVFVLKPPAPVEEPFRSIDFDRVSSMIELLEIRTAVEVEAAGLAALRRSPQQEERVIDCFRDVKNLSDEGTSTSQADFRLHLAIAEATNNPRFGEFLSMIGPNVIPRRALNRDGEAPASADYLKSLNEEHERIVSAILEGDAEGARAAMRKHLERSQSRYRALLRRDFQAA